MSSVELAARTGAPSPVTALGRTYPLATFALLIVLAAALGQLTALAKVTAVWSTGAFFDTDDAMRMVQVRDLIAGQSWFDMTAYRLDPPAGVFMHWSRIVDVPLVLLIKSFKLAADPVKAERLARLAFPLLLTIGLFALLVPLCERLLGAEARLPALAAAFLSGPATGQFEPGRIDHHAPQIVLLVVCVSALTHAAITRHVSRAAWAGVAMALSLGISVENVPFLAPVFGWLALLWIIRGVHANAVLAWFSAGLAGALPLVYAGTISPARWLLVSSDALSLAQGAAVFAGTAFLGGLILAGRRLPNDWRLRAAVAGVGGAVAVICLASAFPTLVQDPFSGLDPLMRTAWLNGVDEAQPLMRKIASDPLWSLGVVCPALIGLIGSIREALQATQANRRAAWFLLTLMLLGGLAASCLMVRTLSTTLTLAVPGALALALAMRDKLAVRRKFFEGPFASLLLLLAVSPMGWAIAGTQAKQSVIHMMPVSSMDRAIGNLSLCTAPESFAAMADLPPGLILAEPDLGSFILAHTPHAVVAGAYHRNVHGMRTALDVLLARPDDAEHAMRASGARYFAFCRAATSPTFAKIAPDGLAAFLTADAQPAWLRHVAARNSAIDVYTID